MMRGIGQGLCLLIWIGRGVSAASNVCSAGGTIQAPLESATLTLDTLTANLRLVPDCHVYEDGNEDGNALAKKVPCRVRDGATVWFWFTCQSDPRRDTEDGDGCEEKDWFVNNAKIMVKDLTPPRDDTVSFEPATSTTKEWDGNESYPHWKRTLRHTFLADDSGYNFADVNITWRGPGPRAGDRIHLHTSIDHMTLDDEHDCTGNVEGSGNGDSSLKVGRTTSTTRTETTTSTTCQWVLKPCGQCLATPVEYCPANPETDDAQLGPVSGFSFDTPTLDTSRLRRRLGKKGCVAAASLYPEVAMCRDEHCSKLKHVAEVETGKRISIKLKITNHCMNKVDKDKRALLTNETLGDLSDVAVLLDNSYISAEFATLDELTLKETFFNQRSLDGSMPLPAFPQTDIPLAEYTATLKLNDDNQKQKVVEISARLRDRSIQIMEEENEVESDDCAQEEGTAWGSTAITVLPITTTTTRTTSTKTTSTTTTTTTETSTQTSTSSTRTTSTSSTATTTTRPCGCFEMCCEPEPVQGVHLPVVPNVCPEWWQGKMTGRASEANASGLSSGLDGSLKTKKSQKPGEVECAGCDAGASGAGPSVFFQSPSERNFFQKWSREAGAGSASAGRSPWEAIGVVLAASVVMVQAAMILRWRKRAAQVEGAGSDVGVTQMLVPRDETVDEFF